MSATTVEYTKMFGNIIEVSDIIPTAKCACVSCNSCTCACSGCMSYFENGEIAWQISFWEESPQLKSLNNFSKKNGGSFMIQYGNGDYSVLFGSIGKESNSNISQCTGCMCQCKSSCDITVVTSEIEWEVI